MCPARPAIISNGGPSLQSGQTPQELLRVFEETQKNMMDLNKKRLAALAEVKTLRARVAKLGEAMPINKDLNFKISMRSLQHLDETQALQ